MDIGNFIKETALGAGEILRAHFGHVKSRVQKGDRGDFATDVDFESERFILDRLKKEFPEHCIVSEEAGRIGESEEGYTWLIDPLDGTRNYATGIPFFSVSIALAQHGVAQYGAVYDPLHDEMFFAARGQGATLNDISISVSSESELEDSIVSVSWIKRRTEHSQFVGYVDRITRKTSYFRRLGSAALIAAYVACGRADIYMQGGINAWDIAAGTVLIEEAGGLATDFEGVPVDLTKPYTDIISGNPALHKRVMDDIIRR